jgi:putative lipoprotein
MNSRFYRTRAGWRARASFPCERENLPGAPALVSGVNRWHADPGQLTTLVAVIRSFALLLVLCLASPARADDWWGRDKGLHFGISIALGAGGYAGSSLLVQPRWARAAIGGGFAIGVGGAKELWDIRHGDPSWRDFTWDVAGSAVGVTVAYLLDLAFTAPSPVGPPPPREPIGPLAR